MEEPDASLGAVKMEEQSEEEWEVLQGGDWVPIDEVSDKEIGDCQAETPMTKSLEATAMTMGTILLNDGLNFACRVRSLKLNSWTLNLEIKLILPTLSLKARLDLNNERSICQ